VKHAQRRARETTRRTPASNAAEDDFAMFTRSLHTKTTTRRVLLAGFITSFSLSLLAADGTDGRGGDRSQDQALGAVLALTNAPGGNAVVMYHRAADGSLAAGGIFPSGGAGTGAGLGSQNAIVVTDDRRFVLAVNAGSHSISSFRLRHDRLELVDTVPSGGVIPTSVAVRNGLVFVLNAGVPNNITGFRLGPQGGLDQLPGFTRPLSAASTSPAQVSFSHDGGVLLVTERATNLISRFTLERDGIDGPFVTPSAGPTPFGFAVGARDTVFVSEAGAGGGASTYRLRGDELDAISSNVMTGQRAACWAALTPNGRFGYVTNAGTGNISGFAIAPDGTAELLDANGVAAATGGNPTDMAMSQDGRYLYARVASLSAIAIFRIGHDGRLDPLPSLTGTPAGLAGLAGF
jgi:6-phosphogluconolactonase (cycloisomerase 2 family)